MTLKPLFSGRKVGTNAALADASAELVDIYTVPATKQAHVKEILYHGFGSANANWTIQLYVLKSGGTDVPTNNSEDINSTNNTGNHDAMGLFAETVFNSLAFTRLATNLVLEAGDKIKGRWANGSGAPRDATSAGIKLHISGYET